MPKVVMLEGPDAGHEYEIDRAAILGRLDSNDIPIKDKKASREHAKIYQQGQKFAIVDLNSSNGTFVNGDEITKRILQPGDQISIGLVSMRFEDPQAEAEPAAATSNRRALDDDFSGQKPDATSGSKAADIVLKSHQPLQFRKVKAGKTLIGFDLDQLSEGGRMIVYAGLIAVFAVLIYLSYVLVAG